MHTTPSVFPASYLESYGDPNWATTSGWDLTAQVVPYGNDKVPSGLN